MTNVLEWLEKRAQEMPDKVAFADEHDEVSFLDLMRRARSVGSYLAGIVDERSPIACYMEKSTQTLAAMFGAVYARCCYSIIDVRQPASRARAIVDQARCSRRACGCEELRCRVGGFRWLPGDMPRGHCRYACR